MRILVVEAGKLPGVREIDGSLESMQKIVGGLIQAVYPFEEPVALICNDEGKLLGLPLNRLLSETRDIISGTFIVAGCHPDTDHFSSLTKDQLIRYKARFRNPEHFLYDGNTIFVLSTTE